MVQAVTQALNAVDDNADSGDADLFEEQYRKLESVVGPPFQRIGAPTLGGSDAHPDHGYPWSSASSAGSSGSGSGGGSSGGSGSGAGAGAGAGSAASSVPRPSGPSVEDID